MPLGESKDVTRRKNNKLSIIQEGMITNDLVSLIQYALRLMPRYRAPVKGRVQCRDHEATLEAVSRTGMRPSTPRSSEDLNKA